MTLTLADLRQFTGDDVRFRNSLNRRVLYTPGIQYLTEQAGAYWLIDAIAILLGSPEFGRAIGKDGRIGQMHFWRLIVADDKSAVLDARVDGPDQPFQQQQLPWTDFPLDRSDLWAAFDGEHWTVYLPSGTLTVVTRRYTAAGDYLRKTALPKFSKYTTYFVRRTFMFYFC